MTVEQIDIELKELAAKIKPLAARQESLGRERRRLLSVAWINANGVTKADVEASDGAGKPYFQIITMFAQWMRDTKSTKRFCEWNGTVYFAAEIMAGRMDPNAPGRMEDVR